MESKNPIVAKALMAKNSLEDDMLIKAYQQSFNEGAKKVLEGINKLNAARQAGITNLAGLKKKDPDFCAKIDKLLDMELVATSVIGKSKR